MVGLQTGCDGDEPNQVAGGADNHAAVGNTGQDVYKAMSGGGLSTTDGDDLLTSVEVNVTAAAATGDYFFHVSDAGRTTAELLSASVRRSRHRISARAGRYLRHRIDDHLRHDGLNFSQDVRCRYRLELRRRAVSNDTFEADRGRRALPDPHVDARPPLRSRAHNHRGELRQGGGAWVGADRAGGSIVIDADTLIPEPGSLGILAGGALMALRRRRK